MILASKSLGVKLPNPVCKARKKRFSESSEYSENTLLAHLPENQPYRED